MLKIKLPIIVLAAILGICLGCAKEEEVSGLARVGDKVITEEDLEARMHGMPPFMKQQLSTPEGRKRFLQGLVEEETIVRDALARGLHKTNDFKREIERGLQNLDYLNDPRAYDKQEQLKAMGICADGLIRFAERHAEKARQLAGQETDPRRKGERERSAEV